MLRCGAVYPRIALLGRRDFDLPVKAIVSLQMTKYEYELFYEVYVVQRKMVGRDQRR